ncbi:MAG: VCBS repeat-containing protein [Chloroflexota bacterium]|nr:VCBS repeat-containing protein [Chloroflexota bacterium]
MASSEWRIAPRLLLAALVIVILALLPCSASLPPWQVYTFQDNSFTLLPASSAPLPLVPLSPCPLPTPPTWHVTAATLADVTNDGDPEWVLLVWRPWRDWPIQHWLPVHSPIAGFHDASGDSCHLILLDPHDGREIWAGSALPAPLLALAVGDVNGDGHNEVVTLEGEYATGRGGSATHVNVWRWNGFGFAMEYRSSTNTFRQLYLTDANNDGILDIAVR